MTGVAGNVMGHESPVADFIVQYVFPCLDNLTRNLMAQHQGRFADTVPLHDIAAADAARHNLDQQFAGADLWHRHFFQLHLPVIVVHCHAHRNCPILNFPPLAGEIEGGKIYKTTGQFITASLV
jgi:hypothetical protein